MHHLWLQCYRKYNKQGNSDYPLCAAQLKDFMYAAKDTPTCIRKTNMPNPIGSKFCFKKCLWYHLMIWNTRSTQDLSTDTIITNYTCFKIIYLQISQCVTHCRMYSGLMVGGYLNLQMVCSPMPGCLPCQVFSIPHLGGESNCKSTVACLGTQHSDPSRWSNLIFDLRSSAPTAKPLLFPVRGLI